MKLGLRSVSEPMLVQLRSMNKSMLVAALRKARHENSANAELRSVRTLMFVVTLQVQMQKTKEGGTIGGGPSSIKNLAGVAAQNQPVALLSMLTHVNSFRADMRAGRTSCGAQRPVR